METLTFKVDGEYVCQLARSWFWDEDKPFEKCQELLIGCLCTDAIGIDEKKAISIEILEGRKILRGINTFSLEEDGEHIRPLTDKIKENEKKLTIYRIQDEIERYPEMYIDIYACPKEISEYEPIYMSEWDDIKTIPDYIRTEKEMVRLWLYATKNWYSGKYSLQDKYYRPDTYVDNGAYLMDAEFIYDVAGDTISNIGEQDFYRKLYEYWESHPKKKGIEERQLLYLAEIKSASKKAVNDSVNEPMKTDELYKIADPDFKIGKEYMSEYGLIDRKGYYYSCGFAGHNAKAFSIISKNHELFGFDDEVLLKSDRMMDVLIEKGWIAVRNPSIGGDPYFYMKSSVVATKAQINAAFDYMAHFKRRSMEGLDNIMKTENMEVF